ncbi:MAG: formate/nitrite transporter family protein [Tunicatimonas sp.]
MDKTDALTPEEKQRLKERKQQQEEQNIDKELDKIEVKEKKEDGRNLDKLKEGEQILQEQMRTSLLEYRRDTPALFVSAFSAGLEVGFSLLLMGLLYTMFSDQLSESGMHMAMAAAYPIGFIFVIIGRSELFTEHTTLAVLPVLNGTVSISALAKLWGIVYVGNLMGGYLFSFILVQIGPGMGTISLDAFHHIAEKLIQYNWWLTLSSGMFAGWLMGLLSWLVTSSRDTISRVVMIILVTTVIGLGELHHSIVGSIEMFAGLISSEDIGLRDYAHFQVFATLGNIIGGTVFVAAVKYGQLGDRTFMSKDS